ncbi:restriction endonuclease subunit S [Sinorhizobium alkalisoli]|uniref:Type I restriction modification DNA specificity domain-containing protein n=1 Tax=Sinorhizobium alkalisoli TaxID=1752398 RepID=A0A1E3V620_9HYPH|nr:restriction endonuclease subunit S [Sinorhizobium alkalisoli]ODR88867.1 hypothetical protein A8M32_20475 [Sinorhizobium alkalisoli]
MSGLPRGWVEATLGEVATKIGSGATPTGGEQSYQSTGIPLIRSLNVHFDGVREEGLAFLDDMQAAKLDNVIVQENDVLLNITGASIGRVAIAPSVYSGARVNQHVSIIRLVKDVVPRFVSSFLASPSAQDFITRENYGATRQALTKAMIEGFAFPLPPLAEQKRIVAKLDALNAKPTRARTELARIETLVSRYKQAVLSKAFSGELTSSEVSSWLMSTLGELAVDVRYGTAEKCAFAPELTPVLRIPNVADGRIDLSDLKHASFNEKELKKLALVEGDLLVIRSNGSVDLVGRSAVVNAAAAGMLFAGYLIRIRLDLKKALPQFVQHWMQSSAVRRAIENAAKSTSGVNNVNSQQLQALKLQLPPLEEQQEIVRRIESAFAKIDCLAAEARRALELVGRLDEAILAKAFRGELVPQDEGDEPAEKLLERIRAERAAAPKAKRGRGPR